MRPAVLLATLGLVAAACSAGDPVVYAPDPEGFDPAGLIDLLPPDQIPSIDTPVFEDIVAAGGWLTPASPVVVLVGEREARAYPLAILTWHEIVNDEFEGGKVAVTYCPLCNSAVVYERTVDRHILEFGVSGKLYRSDLVMYDRQTGSLWPQIAGVAVRGPLKGRELTPVPSSIVSFGEFADAHADGRVLARPGDARPYGQNPYPGYDSRRGPNPDFLAVLLDRRLEAMERVVGVAAGDAARAYPYATLARERVLHDRLGDVDLVVLWTPGARSALDASAIADGREVGATGVFVPRAGDRDLTFASEGEGFRDRETGSTWSVLGIATAGELEGARLEPIHHLDAFWFAWAAFVPHTEVAEV